MKEAIKNELLEEFNRGLRYHPLVQRVKGLSKEVNAVIDAAATQMCKEKRTSAKDINEAEALAEALDTICPLWPILK